MNRIFAAFPLLALPVAAYNLVLLATGGFAARDAATQMGSRTLSVRMISDGVWDISVGDLLLASGLILLFVEMLKSTTSRGAAIVNHALSVLLLAGCLAEFLLLAGFATSTFFLLTLMVLLDMLAGFIVTIIGARRQVDVTRPKPN